MADQIFVEGLFFEKPRDGAPDFIKGRLSVHAVRFAAFVEQYKNENGYVNIDLKESKEGKLYLALNTYKKEVAAEKTEGDEKISADDIPF